MVRRLKKDVLKQLPEIQYEVITVDETGEVKKALEAEEMLGLDPDMLEERGVSPDMVGPISTVRKLMGVAMAPQVADYVNMVMDGGEEKVFLVAWHHEVMDYLEEHLAKWGVVRVDGRTSAVRSESRKQQFITQKKPGIFLGQLQAVGTGTDGLQKACQRIVVGEGSWVPGENQQVVDRLHRGGQEGSVLAEFMVAPGSISEKIFVRSIEKLQDIHSSLDHKRTWK